MSRAMKGSGLKNLWANNIARDVSAMSNADTLRNLDLDHLLKLREACGEFVVCSEKYVTTRILQQTALPGGKRRKRT